MNSNLIISSYAAVSSGSAHQCGNAWCDDLNQEGFNSFSRMMYKKLNLSYPRFYKMDNLCKLAFICSELVLEKAGNRALVTGPKAAVMLSNHASSLDTDRLFNDTVSNQENDLPSPAVFVYTLPNISIGEICIKNKIKGENAFFIFDGFDVQFTFDYVSELFQKGRAETCICGWCDFDLGKEDAFFMLVEKSTLLNNQLVFDVDTIEKLYKKK